MLSPAWIQAERKSLITWILVPNMSKPLQPPLSILPNPHCYMTGHSTEGYAIIRKEYPLGWKHVDDDQTALSVVYTTSCFPVSLADDQDIRDHDALTNKGLGLTNPDGSVMRYVEFSPGYACPMHRTLSFDMGIVIDGEIEMQLDSGETRVLRRGDIALQRATQHKWVNASNSEWARMLFVLQDCASFEVDGKEVKTELGTNSHKYHL